MSKGIRHKGLGNGKRTRLFGFWLFAAILFALLTHAEAQQPAKVAKIGWLSPGFNQTVDTFKQFIREFHKLGYVEGKNVVFESRYFGNDLDRIPALAEELVRLNLDVIVTRGTPETLAFKK